MKLMKPSFNETNNAAFYDECVLLSYGDGMHSQDTVIISTNSVTIAFDMY